MYALCTHAPGFVQWGLLLQLIRCRGWKKIMCNEDEEGFILMRIFLTYIFKSYMKLKCEDLKTPVMYLYMYMTR